MKNNKINKLDLIFLIGIATIGLLSSIIDVYVWRDVEYGGFPVYSVMSIYGSYAFWFILLIYSSVAYKQKEDKPKYVKWYTFFLLPFFHILFVALGMVIGILIIKGL